MSAMQTTSPSKTYFYRLADCPDVILEAEHCPQCGGHPPDRAAYCPECGQCLLGLPELRVRDRMLDEEPESEEDDEWFGVEGSLIELSLSDVEFEENEVVALGEPFPVLAQSA